MVTETRQYAYFRYPQKTCNIISIYKNTFLPAWMDVQRNERRIGNAAVADKQGMVSKGLGCVSVRAMHSNSQARLQDILPPLRQRTSQEMSEDTNSLAEAESWLRLRALR